MSFTPTGREVPCDDGFSGVTSFFHSAVPDLSILALQGRQTHSSTADDEDCFYLPFRPRDKDFSYVTCFRLA